MASSSKRAKTITLSGGAEKTEDIKVLPTRLLATNLPECDQNTILQKLRGVSGSGLVDVKMLGGGSAILVFADNALLNKALSKSISVNGKRISCEIYQPKPANQSTACLIDVTGVDAEVTEDCVRIYFENTKRSGGGKIDKFVLDYSTKQAHIRFADMQAAWRVAFQYQHRINGVVVHADYCTKVPASPVDICNYSSIRVDEDENTCWSMGSCSLTDGGCLVTDRMNNRLKRLNAQFSVVECLNLPDCPWAVCSNSTEAAVSLPNKRTVVMVSLGGKMRILREIQVGHTCYGVAWHRDKLVCGVVQSNRAIMLAQYNWSSGEEMLGTVMRDEEQENITYNTPRQIAVSGERIYVVFGDSRLVILDGDLNLVKVVRMLYVALGVCVGEAGNVFVSGRDERPWQELGTVREYNKDGEFINTIISHEQMKQRWPSSLSYIRELSILVVTINNIDEICTFYLKKCGSRDT